MKRRLLPWLRYAIAVVAHHSGADSLSRKMGGTRLVVVRLYRLRDEHDPSPRSLANASF